MAIVIKSNLRNIAFKKESAYLTTPVNYLRITSNELLEAAARNSGINKATIFAGLNAVVNEFENYLLKGHPVQVPELGSFRVSLNAKAAATAEEAGAKKVYRRRIIFTPTTDLRTKLNEVALTQLGADILTSADDPAPEPGGGD